MNLRNYKPIKEKNFVEFSKTNFFMKTNLKGGYYALKKLNQFIFICKKPYYNRLKTKILNRKANFIYEIEQEKYFVCLIDYETENQYLSIKRLFNNYSMRNRSNDMRHKSFKIVLNYEK